MGTSLKHVSSSMKCASAALEVKRDIEWRILYDLLSYILGSLESFYFRLAYSVKENRTFTISFLNVLYQDDVLDKLEQQPKNRESRNDREKSRCDRESEPAAAEWTYT